MQYTKISHMNPAERVEALTASLVSLSSVNGTVGEGTKADFIKEVITSYPYFQENPSHVWEQAIPNDPYNRKNIFAFIKDMEKAVIQSFTMPIWIQLESKISAL